MRLLFPIQKRGRTYRRLILPSDGERQLSEEDQPLTQRGKSDADQTEACWNLDVNSPAFAAEARRQSLLVANSPEEREHMAFIESLAKEFLALLDADDERANSESTGLKSSADRGSPSGTVDETSSP